MPISNEVADGVTEVDVIVCGGGTAGCVVAGRLAEADPSLAVLLIEGGESNVDNDLVKYPALFPQHLTPNSKTAIFHQGKKSDALAGRAPVVPSGGLLGGGSSVNIMLYSRAQGVDFDSWRTAGWSADDLIPFMSKLENYQGPGNKSTHGYSGPVRISENGPQTNKAGASFMDAATSLGYCEYQDLQDPKQVNNGVEWTKSYKTEEGYRADSAHAYIHPLLNDGKHPNLHVLCESKINRVLFDENKRAIGVEYTPNPQYQPMTNLSTSARFTVKARKLVVLSCGALGTPPILERSGVGSHEILEKASVPVIADVPGVGHNYDDHTLLFYPWATSLGPKDTLDGVWSGRLSMEEAKTSGMLKWNGLDTHGKMRPTEEEIAALGPAFKAAWDKDYNNEPHRPLMMYANAAGFSGDPSLVPNGQYYSVAIYSAYSYSRGSVHITGPDWEDAVDFEPGIFSDPDDLDLKMQIWGYKRIRAIMRTSKVYTGELQIGHPQFPKGSKAACASDVDCSSVTADPEYTEEDDKAIEQFLRQNIGSCWHSLGTAKMAPREEMGVVDSQLSVYGVSGLKVADLSIVPAMVGANTNNTAYVVGEKAADIIMEELGLPK